MAIFIAVLPIDLSDPNAELVAAARNPAVYRVAALLDMLTWFGNRGLLLAFGGYFAARAPIRALVLAAAGAGQVIGALGGYLRLGASLALLHGGVPRWMTVWFAVMGMYSVANQLSVVAVGAVTRVGLRRLHARPGPGIARNRGHLVARRASLPTWDAEKSDDLSRRSIESCRD